MDQRLMALKDRNERVMEQSLVYINKTSRIKNFFNTSIQVEAISDLEEDVQHINYAISFVNASKVYPSSDNDLVFCKKICDMLFLKLSEHFTDSDMKITVTESGGSAITVHYRSYKPTLSIKI